jgi:hypothetical protein
MICQVILVLTLLNTLGGNIAALEKQEVSLVSATVTNVAAEVMSGSTAYLRIDQVFFGLGQLTNLSFSCKIAKKPLEQSYTVIFPSPAVRESGIWAVRSNGKVCIPVFFEVFGRTWPSRKNVDERFDQASMLARAIAAVNGAEPQYRVAMLSGFITNSIPEIACWSATELVSHGDSATNLLCDDGIPKRNLPLASKLVADGMLVDKRGEQWAHSDSRSMFLADIVQQPFDKFEQRMVVQFLCKSAQHDPKFHRQLLVIIKKIVINTNSSNSFRQSSLRLLEYFNNDNNEVFDLLIDQLRSENLQTALTAASILKRRQNLTEQQNNQLDTIKKMIKHDEVRRLLQY